MLSKFAATRPFRRACQAITVAVLAALIWIAYAGRITRESWAIPTAYDIDALEITTEIKLVADQGIQYLWTQHPGRLGAPFTADWSSYPLPDKPFFLLLGLAARKIGLIEATHLGLLLAHALAAGAFFYVSRKLGHGLPWAFAGALLFSFAFFNIFRGLSHFSFTLSYVVPLSLLTSWLVASSHRENGLLGLAVATGLLTGLGSPYYLFLHAQFLVFAILLQMFGERRRANVLAGLASLTSAAVALTITHRTVLAGIFRGNQTFSLARNYAGSEIYGLKFIELFIPPPSHAAHLLGLAGVDYSQMTSLKGELAGPYLGLLGAIAFVGIFIGALRKLIASRASVRPAHAPQIAWILFFFGVGGGGAILAFFGIDFFRAGNRYSIFISAIGLLFGAGWLSRKTLRWEPWYTWLLAIALTALGLRDQMPPSTWPAPKEPNTIRINDDRKFAALLERSLPPSATIFELPAVYFPEHPVVKTMRDYELFRPFLFTSTLRFSYGPMAQSSEFRWEQWVSQLPVAAMIPELESAGFAALYVCRRGFDDRADALEKELQSRGYEELKTGRPMSDHLAFKLHPSSQPKTPNLDDPRISEPWDDQAGKPAEKIPLFAIRGWYPSENVRGQTWRWGQQDASVSVVNSADAPLAVIVSFAASSLSRGEVQLFHDGVRVWDAPTTPRSTDVTNLSLTLKPGINLLEWHFNGKLIRPSRSDPRELGVKLTDLTVKVVPAAPGKAP